MDVLRLKRLSDAACIGHINELSALLPKTTPLFGGSYCATLKGESDYTILLEAHIDEVGFIVTAVDERGFLKVSTVGGLDLRTLPSHRVIIHGKEKLPGVFTSIPPHLTKGEAEFDDIKDLSIDSLLGASARDYISVGDFVTFDRCSCALAGGRFTGKSLDDRAGCAVLAEVYDRLKDERLPVTVKFLFCNQEELGTRGSKTAAFEHFSSEAIALDVSFAAAPGIAPEQCGKLGEGPMLGFSPILSSEISSALAAICDRENIPYQREVMGGRTGTDADTISITKSGIPTGLISLPLRNMHTDAEVVDLSDLDGAVSLLCGYVLQGGIKKC